MISLKNSKEIALMRQAGRISARALQLGGEAVRPGVTTAHINKVIHDYIISQGAQPNFLGLYGFPASACISVNDTVIHGIPSTAEVVHEGDIVSIDTGALYKGWHGDNAGTFVAGTASPEALRLIEVTRQSFYEGLKVAVVGNRIGDISHAIQQYVEANGFSVVREYVGHGLGRELHEDPEVPNYGHPGRGARLVPGMTLAIEPMVNAGGVAIRQLPDGWTVKTKDGSLSAHYEKSIVITANGPVILTDPE
ncbi:MAG TPA: type I methionyl aminopeptidase [Candidatus Pygmaiobacter gallistercoris]|nr:type I methionyl aminopeptidase [Candidatus Pygmaiobacter gallistercoris]